MANGFWSNLMGDAEKFASSGLGQTVIGAGIGGLLGGKQGLLAGGLLGGASRHRATAPGAAAQLPVAALPGIYPARFGDG